MRTVDQDLAMKAATIVARMRQVVDAAKAQVALFNAMFNTLDCFCTAFACP